MGEFLELRKIQEPDARTYDDGYLTALEHGPLFVTSGFLGFRFILDLDYTIFACFVNPFPFGDAGHPLFYANMLSGNSTLGIHAKPTARN